MSDHVMPKVLATIILIPVAIGLAFVDTGFDPKSPFQRFLGRGHNMELVVKESGSLRKGAKKLLCGVLALAFFLLWFVLPNWS